MTARTASLRTRLLVPLGALFLVGMVALYLAASVYATLAADRSYDRLLAGSALSIAETLSLSNDQVTVDIPYAALDMLSAAPNDRVFYRVEMEKKGTVTGYPDLPPVPEPRFQRAGLARSEDLQFFDAMYRGEKVRFVSLSRKVSSPGPAQFVAVQVGQTRRARQGLARELLIGALAPILLMTLLALLIVWFGIRVALRPLSRIGLELSKREPDALGELQTPVPAEVLPLVDALNQFMHRLAAAIEDLKTFIADAAHQIRTPLATISAQAQLAETDDPAEWSRSIAAIQRNTNRLIRLVNQLLSDATTLHRLNLRRFDDLDLLDIVARAVRETVPLLEDSDVRFTSPLKSAPLYGDELMVGEAIKNLIHNAILHGRGETEAEVTIILDGTDDTYTLTVADRGPGIPPEHRDAIFERFSRANSSAPGAGLGMAIIARVVEAHHGTITLDEREGGGLAIRLRLPRRGR